jgi:hypothetical protein
VPSRKKSGGLSKKMNKRLLAGIKNLMNNSNVITEESESGSDNNHKRC